MHSHLKNRATCKHAYWHFYSYNFSYFYRSLSIAGYVYNIFMTIYSGRKRKSASPRSVLRSQTNLHSQYDPINNHGPVPSWSKFNYRTACLSSSSVPLVFLGQGKVQKNNNTVHLFFHQKLTYEHSKRHTVYFRRDFVWLVARRVVAVERYWRGYGPLSDILEEQSPHHLVCFTDTFSMLRSWTDSSVFFTCTRLEDMHRGRCSTSVHSPRPERTVMRGLTGWVVGWLLTHSVHWRMQF